MKGKLRTRVGQMSLLKCMLVSCFTHFVSFIRSFPVADPGGGQSGHAPNPAMAPIQSDSLAINFEFDVIRKNAYTVVN